MREYMSTVSILGSFQAEQLRSRSSACGAGYGGSILRADFTGVGGSLLRADYHIVSIPRVDQKIRQVKSGGARKNILLTVLDVHGTRVLG
jgi:hypothetical protein